MTEKISGKFATQHNGLQIFFDIYKPAKINKGTIIFCHGFKGFRNWGAWNLMADYFSKNGFATVLFDFSTNGIGNFNDTELTNENLFAINTLSQDQEDLTELFQYLKDNAQTLNLNIDTLILMGHSRGGATALNFAMKHEFINKLILLAPVADLIGMYKKMGLEQWKKNGFVEISNKRTGQILKLNYSFWEDLMHNKELFDVDKNASLLQCELLIIHGTNDEAVAVSESQKIYEACLHSILIEIEGANHTFGISHPWEKGQIFPAAFNQVLAEITEFLD